jgi:hypothetical protein
MPKRTAAEPSWADCKAATGNWPAARLRELLHELYRLSEENRRFLLARLLPPGVAAGLDDAKCRLRKLLSTLSADASDFSHAEVRRLIDLFAKATGDKAGVADLLVIDLETSYQIFGNLGGYREMVNHIYATMRRLDKVLPDLPAEPLRPLVERLVALARRWHDAFGYGLSDELEDFAREWAGRVARLPARGREGVARGS